MFGTPREARQAVKDLNGKTLGGKHLKATLVRDHEADSEPLPEGTGGTDLQALD